MNLRFQSLCVAVATFIAVIGSVHAQSPTVKQDVENTLRRFFAAMSSRDTSELRSTLNDQVSVIKAGQRDAKIGSLKIENGSEILPPVGNADWNKEKVTLTSVKVEVSDTHPSVAMASFTLSFRLSDKQVEGLKIALKNPSAEFNEKQLREIQKRITDRAVQNALFAMVARQSGAWKIVGISVPQ